MMKPTIYTAILRHKLAATLHTLATVPAMLAALALPLVLATSCSTDELVNPATPTPGQQITITASLGNGGNNSTDKPGTRMDYAPDDASKGLKTTWTVGDAFNIVPFDYGETDAYPFTLATGVGTASGTFTGTAPAVGTTYNVYHPTSITTSALFNTFSYTGQVQAGNDNRDHLTAKHSIRLTELEDYKEIDFSNPTDQSSCMKFVLTLPTGLTSPTKITLSTEDGSACFWPTNKSSDNKIKVAFLSLALQDITLGTDNKLTAYMMMSCRDVTLPGDIRVMVTSADKKYYQTITLQAGTKLTGGKMHSITVSDASGWKELSTTYTNATKASTILYTDNGTTTNAGTATNPYLISSAEDLKLVQDVTNNTATNTYKNKCYKLTTDITITTNSTSWTPIGNSTTGSEFKGTFDGDGHSVTGLYINTDQTYQGFFGYINGGKVMNLNVTGEIISTYSQSNGLVGGISGQLFGNSYIIGCCYSGSITSTGSGTYIGGICGDAHESYVIGCYNTSAVTSTTQQSWLYCGGIAGHTSNSNVRIIGCYNTGAVTGTNNTRVGGIVARNQGKVMGCYNTGSVTGTNVNDASCGGILGRSAEDVTTGCLWVKSSTTGTAKTGIGENYSGAPYEGTNITGFDDIATLNSDANIAILNAAIDTWNSDTSDTKGPKGDTTSPKYCHYKFETGKDGNTPPILVSTQQP